MSGVVSRVSRSTSSIDQGFEYEKPLGGSQYVFILDMPGGAQMVSIITKTAAHSLGLKAMSLCNREGFQCYTRHRLIAPSFPAF